MKIAVLVKQVPGSESSLPINLQRFLKLLDSNEKIRKLRPAAQDILKNSESKNSIAEEFASTIFFRLQAVCKHSRSRLQKLLTSCLCSIDIFYPCLGNLDPIWQKQLYFIAINSQSPHK